MRKLVMKLKPVVCIHTHTLFVSMICTSSYTKHPIMPCRIVCSGHFAARIAACYTKQTNAPPSLNLGQGGDENCAPAQLNFATSGVVCSDENNFFHNAAAGLSPTIHTAKAKVCLCVCACVRVVSASGVMHVPKSGVETWHVCT